MMSLIDLDDDQRWVPTHVNVTVLRARGLRTKGKHGSRYLYTIIQVGKEKYTTGLVEKAEVPEWNEECCFELLPGILEEGSRGAYPPGSGDLVLTVMHRVLIGLDVFLGQTIIPLDKIFQEGTCPRDEWFKLHSKVGRKEKERGELQVTVQFTRNNMTASMFDLTMKDKPRSAFGKLKDRVTGRKRGDMESSSAIVPGRYAALSGSVGFGEEGGAPVDSVEVEVTEEKRSKVKDFFKGKLRKSSDTKSCSSLGSESSMSSMASENLGPPPSLDLLSDPPSSPIYTTRVRVDTHYGETDLAKKVLTSQHTTKVLTHKRAFSDEVSKITTAFPRTNPTVESLKGQTMTQSKSSLCINGSHVYESEPSTPKVSGPHPSKLVLLEKCSPLSRSLQNLTKRSEDKGSFAEGRRWSFDKTKKEEEKESLVSSVPAPHAEPGAAVPSAADSPDKGKKLKKTLFSSGRSDSLPAKSDLNQATSSSEGRLRGWFGSGDSQNKPRLEVSPKIESSSDVPPPLPPRSPVPPQYSSPSGRVSPEDHNPFTPSPSPSSTPLSPSDPFPSHMQRNPFFEDLIAEESQRSPPFVPSSPSGSSVFSYSPLPSHHHTTSSSHDAKTTNMASIKRERPRPVARQISLPTLLPKAATPNSPRHSALYSASDSFGHWDDSFDAFASSRLNSPKENLPQKQPRASSTSSHAYFAVNTKSLAEELQACEEEPPPLPPRRLLRTPVNEIYSDGWLHRGQELAVHKEAYLLSQTGVASRQRGREGDSKRHSLCSDPHTSGEASESCSLNSRSHRVGSSPGVATEDKQKKFKYEPLEDEGSCWGGMLFEQDLYGRMCRGNYGQPQGNNQHLSLKAEKTPGNKITRVNSGAKMALDSEISAADLMNSTLGSSSKPDAKAHEDSAAAVQETEAAGPENACINNNVSFSLNLGDLNMNINNLDFTFIDSDGSSHSDAVDTLKGINSIGGKSSEDSQRSVQDAFTLKDTYIPEMNSSFEITPSTNALCKIPAVCQDFHCEANNPAQHGTSRTNSRELTALSTQTPTCDPPVGESRKEIMTNVDHLKKDFDDNGNPQGKAGALNQKESFPGVISARFRPSGVSRQNSSGSPNSWSISNDREFEQLLSLVKNISRVSEGPLSYQPTKSALSSLLALKGDGINKDQEPVSECHSESQVPFKNQESLVKGKPSHMSFEDLHAKVAPHSKTPSKPKIGQSLQEPEPPPPSILCALSLSADTRASLHATPLGYPTIGPSSLGPSTHLTLPPCTSSFSSSYSSFSTFTSTSTSTDQPLVDARPSLLPEETQPASNLPLQESRPHPVKPLTSSQSEKKEGRSVLEKLKSTINPGRSAQQAAAEPDKSQEVAVDRAAQYQHLTNMELISLLLQQEMDMQKQQAASEQQEAQLQKCEAELKKVKLKVRDLEDYIDNLLLRIMEQTPTLLQVRSRHK